MHINQLHHAGWERNLQISNGKVEIIITLDVGPRVISFKTTEGENVFKNYPEQLGKGGESEWMIRGGHRVWLAPEHEVLSYLPDNEPVTHELLGKNGAHFVNPGVAPWNIKKEMTVTLSEHSSEVTVVHRATNDGREPAEVATWGLTVMAPGGLEIIPLPPLGEHPRDLLPNRPMVAWPYTDFSDPRWRFGWRFITLRQTADGTPTKLGLAHREKWVGYLLPNALFLKAFDYEEGAVYPDVGCNFETFTNADMLEVEALSPLRKLAPGESVSHTERWYLFDVAEQPDSLKENDLAEWLEPMLKSAGL
jgi:hypothetical protein